VRSARCIREHMRVESLVWGPPSRRRRAGAHPPSLPPSTAPANLAGTKHVAAGAVGWWCAPLSRSEGGDHHLSPALPECADASVDEEEISERPADGSDSFRALGRRLTDDVGLDGRGTDDLNGSKVSVSLPSLSSLSVSLPLPLSLSLCLLSALSQPSLPSSTSARSVSERTGRWKREKKKSEKEEE
jgi:hypothetical protein